MQNIKVQGVPKKDLIKNGTFVRKLDTKEIGIIINNQSFPLGYLIMQLSNGVSYFAQRDLFEVFYGTITIEVD